MHQFNRQSLVHQLSLSAALVSLVIFGALIAFTTYFAENAALAKTEDELTHQVTGIVRMLELSHGNAIAHAGRGASRLKTALGALRIGYAGELAAGSIVPHEYLELHIEQGPVLEAEGVQIGAVANLQGISWQQLTIQGKANHAGTTPMHLRHDAGFAAAAIVTFVRQLAAQSGTTLATVGSLHFEPDLINVIPRKAQLTVDLRDPDESRLQAAEQALRDYLVELEQQEHVRIHSERLARFEPVPFAEPLVAEVEHAAAARGLSCRRMTSGAGHDAQMIARIAPAAMIFVPSHGGISHNPREHTDDAQLLQGAQVLLDVVLKRLLA